MTRMVACVSKKTLKQDLLEETDTLAGKIVTPARLPLACVFSGAYIHTRKHICTHAGCGESRSLVTYEIYEYGCLQQRNTCGGPSWQATFMWMSTLYPGCLLEQAAYFPWVGWPDGSFGGLLFHTMNDAHPAEGL